MARGIVGPAPQIMAGVAVGALLSFDRPSVWSFALRATPSERRAKAATTTPKKITTTRPTVSERASAMKPIRVARNRSG